MQIHRITIENYSRWRNRRAIIDLDVYGPGAIQLAGRNGAGKTTILTALLAAMLGEDPHTADIDRKAHTGRAVIEVEHTFAGHRWRHRLEIKRSKKNDGKQKFEHVGFVWRDGEALAEFSGPGKWTAYKAHNLALLGSQEFFYTTAYSVQRAAPLNNRVPTSLAQCTPEQSEKILAVAGGVDAQKAFALGAFAKAKAAREQLDGLRPQVERLASLEARIAQTTDRQTAAAEALDAAQQAHQRAGDRLTQATAERDALRAQQAEAERVTERRRALLDEHTRHTQAQERERATRAAVDDAASAYDAARAVLATAVDRLTAAQTAAADVHQAILRRQDAERVLADMRGRLATMQADHERTRDNANWLRAQVEGAERDLQAAQTSAERAETALAVAQAEHGAASSQAERRADAERALREATAAAERAATARQQAQQRAQDAEHAAQQAQDAERAAVEAFQRASAGEAEALRQRRDALREQYQIEQERLDVLRGEREAAQQRVTEARDEVRARQADVTQANAAHEAARLALDAAQRQAALVDEVPCRGQGGFATCKLLAVAVQARQQVPALTAALDERGEAARDAAAAARDAEDVVRVRIADVETRDRALYEQRERMDALVKSGKEAAAALRAAEETETAARAALDDARSRRATADSALALARQGLDNLTAQSNQALDARTQAEARLAELPTVDLAGAAARLTATQGAARQAADRLRSLRETIARRPELDTLADRLATLATDVQALAQRADEAAASLPPLPDRSKLDALTEFQTAVQTARAGEKWAHEARDDAKRDHAKAAAALGTLRPAQAIADDLEALPAVEPPDEIAVLFAGQAVDEAESALATAAAGVREAQSALDEIGGALGALRAELAAMGDVRAQIAALEEEVARWKWLYGEISRLITLMVQATAPALSARINRFLAECFGDRYRVRIEPFTENSSNDGERKTYTIWVLDTETGEERHLDTFSGGEFGPQLQAIQYGLMLYRNENCDRPWLTPFVDEGDAALDPDAYGQWKQMMAAVIESGALHQVLIVSHKGELEWAQQLDVSAIDGEPIDAEDGEADRPRKRRKKEAAPEPAETMAQADLF